jgi:hypothetical protein
LSDGDSGLFFWYLEKVLMRLVENGLVCFITDQPFFYFDREKGGGILFISGKLNYLV